MIRTYPAGCDFQTFVPGFDPNPLVVTKSSFVCEDRNQPVIPFPEFGPSSLSYVSYYADMQDAIQKALWRAFLNGAMPFEREKRPEDGVLPCHVVRTPDSAP